MREHSKPAAAGVEFGWERAPAGRPDCARPPGPRKALLTVGLSLITLAGAGFAVAAASGDRPGIASLASAAQPGGAAVPVRYAVPRTMPVGPTPIASSAQPPSLVPIVAPTDTPASPPPGRPAVGGPGPGSSPGTNPGSSPRPSPSPTPPVSTGPPQPIGAWQMNSGTGTTALDSVAHHDGAATNIAWVGAAAEFNGSTSEITVPEQVVDTGPGQSFTIAVWAYLWKDSAFATIVSQDGSVNSGFYLEYSQADNRWAFARVSVDALNPTPHRALSSNPPALNTWTPLVGVFNGATDQLQLYVNGQLQGTATDPTPFASYGDLVFGRSIASRGQSAWFPGLIDGVKIFNQALTAAQIREVGGYE